MEVPQEKELPTAFNQHIWAVSFLLEPHVFFWQKKHSRSILDLEFGELFLFSHTCFAVWETYTLPQTNIFAPRKWMVGIQSFPFGAWPISWGEMLVLGRAFFWQSYVNRDFQVDDHIFLFCGKTWIVLGRKFPNKKTLQWMSQQKWKNPRIKKRNRCKMKKNVSRHVC